MKLTLEHYDIKAFIENGHDDMTVSEVLEDLVIPLLVAAGFCQEGIESAMAEYCDCECSCENEEPDKDYLCEKCLLPTHICKC